MAKEQKIQPAFDVVQDGECCICHATYDDWGNNALPVMDGRCCFRCNETVVIPARIERMRQGKGPY
jgi:hypothetical protein